MATFYQGQIIMFGGSFAIKDFSECGGQLLHIAQYHALFSLLGTAYGGDGRSTFNLPDLRGRAPVHQGATNWGQNLSLGDAYGHQQTQLGVDHMPAHTHGTSYDASGGGGGGLTVQNSAPSQNNPTSDSYLAGFAQGTGPSKLYTDQTGNEQTIKGVSGGGFDVSKLSIESTGGGDSFDITAPRLAVTFLMCMNGTYPSRGG